MKLDDDLVQRAATALFNYERKRGTEKDPKKKLALLESHAKSVITQIQLTKDITKPVIKPVRVKIPNSLFSEEEEHSICLFCRSEDKALIEENMNMEKKGSAIIEGFNKVISLNEVRKFYSSYKDKKALLTEYTHFVCDARVMRQLYNLLGKVFGARHNYPVPIEYNEKNGTSIAAGVRKSIDSTYMHLSGHQISISIGNTTMEPSHVAENIVAGLNFAILKFKNAWKDVHSIHLKTSDSASLPIYSKVTNEMTTFVATKMKEEKKKKKKIAAAAAEKVEEEEEEEKEKKKVSKVVATKKSATKTKTAAPKMKTTTPTPSTKAPIAKAAGTEKVEEKKEKGEEKKENKKAKVVEKVVKSATKTMTKTKTVTIETKIKTTAKTTTPTPSTKAPKEVALKTASPAVTRNKSTKSKK